MSVTVVTVKILLSLVSTERISNTLQTLENAWFMVQTAGVTVTKIGQSYCQHFKITVNQNRRTWDNLRAYIYSRASLAKTNKKPTQAICEQLWAICGRGFNSDNKKAVVNLHKYRICSS